MRTNALVSLGSALVMLAGLSISATTNVNVLGHVMQGIITGIVGAKSGVAASTLTHGGAIFLLSSGLIWP